MGTMVFWATTPAAVRRFAETGSQSVADKVFAATDELRAAFGYQPSDDEDADFAAQLFASLQCLVDGGDRLVVAVELDRAPVAAAPGPELGRVGQVQLPWRRVRAIFRDAPEDLAELRAYAESLQGKEIEALWEDDQVRGVLTEHDLLWYDGSELAQALDGLRDPDPVAADPRKDA